MATFALLLLYQVLSMTLFFIARRKPTNLHAIKQRAVHIDGYPDGAPEADARALPPSHGDGVVLRCGLGADAGGVRLFRGTAC